MNKYLKYTLKGFGILLGILVLLYCIAAGYILSHKKSIVSQVTAGISKRLNGEVTIREVDLSFFSEFPRIAIVLKDMSVKDTMYSSHGHVFFQAEKIFVKASILKLLQKEVSLTGVKVQNASMYLFTDTNGYTNKYLFSPKQQPVANDSSANNKRLPLKDITLENLHVLIDDRQRDKQHDLEVNNLVAEIEDRDSVFFFKSRNNILVHTMAFNPSRGSFLKEKTFKGNFDFIYRKQTKQLVFDSINVRIADHPFNITASFDVGRIPAPQLMMRVSTKNIGYEFTKTLLPEKIAQSLSLVQMTGTLNASATLTGPLKGGDPLININWSAEDADLATPMIDFTNCAFTGHFTNEVAAGMPRKDPNSSIDLYNFKGEWKGLPLSSDRININNLYDPFLSSDLKTNFPLTTLNDALNSSSISFNQGQAMVDISYKGPLINNTSYNSFVNGVLTISNGVVNYNPRDIPLKNVNGRVVFRNSDIYVEDLRCLVLGNSITMNGTAKNVLSLVESEMHKVVLDWNIHSPSLNLASFTSLLKKRKKTVATKNSHHFENAAKRLDDIMENGSFNLNLTADRLQYKKFEASNVIADVSILPNSWQLHKVALQHAGGEMNISGSLQDINNSDHSAKLNLSLSNVDVNKVFNAFNNFGQDGITAESIRGKLTSGINLAFEMSEEGRVYKSTVNGDIDFSLKQGELINYEPVMKLQEVIFKKRDFSNIQFAELKNKLEIKNQEIRINRMEIASTVLSMFVEGTYSLLGKTDISIQVPLRNLKKRDKDFIPENIGADKKGGTSIYLRGTPGPDGNIKFKYDLFKKFRKNKTDSTKTIVLNNFPTQ